MDKDDEYEILPHKEIIELRQELERLKTVYIQQNANLKSKLNDKTDENEELSTKCHNLDKSIAELDKQLKNIRQEFKSKDKSHLEVMKNMEK